MPPWPCTLWAFRSSFLPGVVLPSRFWGFRSAANEVPSECAVATAASDLDLFVPPVPLFRGLQSLSLRLPASFRMEPEADLGEGAYEVGAGGKKTTL